MKMSMQKRAFFPSNFYSNMTWLFSWSAGNNISQSRLELFNRIHKTTEEKREQVYSKNRCLWLPLMVRGQLNWEKEKQRMTQSTKEQGSVHVRSFCVLDRKKLVITCPLHLNGGSKALSLNSTLFITAINTNKLHTLAPHHSHPQRPLTILHFKKNSPSSDWSNLSKMAWNGSRPCCSERCVA